jgi:CpeT protein
MKNAILPLLVLMTLFACSEKSETANSAPAKPNYYDSLYCWMQGEFSSVEQATADTNFYAISLKMCKLAEEQGQWFELYVEQALDTLQEQPYRQRIYRISRGDSDSSFVSEIFELEADSLVIGACSNDSLKAVIAATSREIREGCEVYLRWNGRDGFVGETTGNNCISTLRGASYARTAVTIMPSGIQSWDQGFDSTGVQVWGPETGPYHFNRK